MEVIVIIILMLGAIGLIQSTIKNSRIKAADRAAKDLITESKYEKMLNDLNKLKDKFNKNKKEEVDLNKVNKYISEENENIGEYTKICPACNRGTLVQRRGPYGIFYGCSTYPRCEHTQKRIQRTRKAKTTNPIFGEMFKEDLNKAYKTK